jgi:transcriptional regulator with XRE-family HTH domain
MGFWGRVKKRISEEQTTQDWVAKKIGTRADTFSRWVQRNTVPRADQVVAIAEALDTTVEYLVTGKNPDNWQPPKRYADIVADLEVLDEKDLETVRMLAAGLAERSSQKTKREA